MNQYREEFKFVELGAMIPNGFTRNCFTTKDNAKDFIAKYNNKDVYQTVCLYEKGNLPGDESLLFGDFYMDFDSTEDIGKAKEDLLCVIKQFKELGVEENKLQIFFSGNKGFHLIIPAELFGIKPSKNLNKIYRKMAKSFCEKIQNKTLDLGIYDRRRLLRIPNSINSKANLYKIPLSFEELQKSIAEIKKLASNQREIAMILEQICVDEVIKLYESCEEQISKEDNLSAVTDNFFEDKKIKDIPPCIQYLLDKGVHEGERNNATYLLTSYFKNNKGYKKGEISNKLQVWNKLNRPPLFDEELNRIIDSTIKKSYQIGCLTPLLETYCDKSHCPYYCSNIQILSRDKKSICLSQDFVDGKMLYTVYVSTQNGEIPVIITNEREIIPLNIHNLNKRNWDVDDIYRKKSEIVFLANHRRWSNDSINSFIYKKMLVVPWELFGKIKELLEKYIDFSIPAYYDLLTIWIMGTYVFMIFDSYGYIFLFGTKRVGKTRTLELVEPLAFNTVMASSISGASIYRLVAFDRCTILCDEAEKIVSAKASINTELLEILRAGYKHSGYVYRCQGEENKPTKFPTYSPKILSNVTGLEEALEDRTFLISMYKATKKLPRFIRRKEEANFKNLCNDLYIFGLTCAKKIYELYSSDYNTEHLRDREEEIWTPIITIARFLDACAKDSTDETLESKMMGLSKKMKEAKEMVEEEENFDIKIIQEVWAHMNRMPKTGNTPDIYIAKELLEGIKIQNSDLENLTANKLSRTLRKLGIIKNKTDKPLKDNQRCYKLTEDRIRESAKRNGIPLLDDPDIPTTEESKNTDLGEKTD